MEASAGWSRPRWWILPEMCPRSPAKARVTWRPSCPEGYTAPTMNAGNPVTDTPTATAPRPEQGEMPFAVVMGKAITELPRDLYIPPQALEVFLEAFEGPLDLLL